MGMKKACSCGYWNEAQQECLYNGSGCIRDDERKLGVAEKKLLEKLEEFRNCKITYSKILYTKEDDQLYQEMRKRIRNN